MAACIYDGTLNEGGLYYDGVIDSPLGLMNKYFSCFKCTGDGDRPLFFGALDGDNLGKLYGYDVTNSVGEVMLNYDESSTMGKSVECLGIYTYDNDDGYTTNASIADTSLTNLGDFMINCGLIGINVNSDGDNAEGVVIVCLACDPGFKPEYGVDSSFILSCTAIEHCDDSILTDTLSTRLWFNNCKNCVHYYDPNTKLIKIDECVAERDEINSGVN